MKFVFISDLSIFGFTACPRLLIAMQIERVWHAVYLHQQGTTSHSGKLKSFPLVTLCTGCKERSRFCVKPQERDLIFLTSSACHGELSTFGVVMLESLQLILSEFYQRQQLLFTQAEGAEQGCALTGQILHGCLLAGVSRYLNLNWLCSCSSNLKQDTKCSIVSLGIKNTCTVFLM